MNPFLRYLADKNSAHTHTHTQTDRQTDRHTPMTTRPCGLRRAGNYYLFITFSAKSTLIFYENSNSFVYNGDATGVE